jgi:hypothetical protein
MLLITALLWSEPESTRTDTEWPDQTGHPFSIQAIPIEFIWPTEFTPRRFI